jgi:hypothetical protein
MERNPDPNKSEKTYPDPHQCEPATLLLTPEGDVEECLPGIKLRVLGPVVDLFLPCKKFC